MINTSSGKWARLSEHNSWLLFTLELLHLISTKENKNDAKMNPWSVTFEIYEQEEGIIFLSWKAISLLKVK